MVEIHDYYDTTRKDIAEIQKKGFYKFQKYLVYLIRLFTFSSFVYLLNFIQILNHEAALPV